MKKLFSVLSLVLLFSVAGNQAFSQVTVTPGAVVYPNFQAAFTAIMAATNPHGLTPTLTVTASFTEVAAGAVLTKTAFFNSVQIYTAGIFTVLAQ